jgi:hypothetical protein
VGIVMLSAVVMTHPSRAEAAALLCQRHPELDLRIVRDPAPDGPVAALRTAARAWQAVRDDATHHLVLQDDVVLRDGFAASLHAAVAARPADAVCLFAEWGSRTAHVCRVAALRGAAWAEAVDEYVPSPAIVLPADAARGFGEFAERALRDGERLDDVAMRGYLDTTGIEASVLVPNLAEHAPGPSLAGNDIMGERRSVCHADAPVPPPALGTAVSGLPVVPHFSWWEGRSVCCLRDPATAAGWRKIPTAEFLAERGLSPDDLRGRFSRAMTGRDAEGTVRDTVSGILLFQLWLTAVALGAVAGDHVPDVGAAACTPVARRALATLAPGGLRRFVPEARMAALAIAIEPLVRDAVCQGAGAARIIG